MGTWPAEASRAQSGERRQLGLLERIVCGTSGIVVELRTSDGPMRFHARRFDDVEFVVYRDDLGGSIECGARKNAEPVFLTWAPLGEPVTSSRGALAGRAVAVEFLPKDDTPK